MTSAEHDEERIRRAVIHAVEGMEVPDRARLARIEQRLLAGARRPRRSPWWWTVAGLGRAAGAAAAYWAIHADRSAGEPGTRSPATPPAAVEHDGGGADGTDTERGRGEAAGQRDDRVIYRGE